jgi:hypothetical protein
MKNIKVIFLRKYTTGKGKPQFIYTLVNPTPEQLASFKAWKGEFYRVDEKTGQTLFFSSRFVGPKTELLLTENGKWVIDDTALVQLASLTQAYGIDVASRVMGSAPVQQQEEVPVEEEVEQPEQPVKTQSTQRKPR